MWLLPWLLVGFLIYGILYLVGSIIVFPFKVVAKVAEKFKDAVEWGVEWFEEHNLDQKIANILAIFIIAMLILTIIATIVSLAVFVFFVYFTVKFTGELTAWIGRFANRIKIIKKIERHYDLVSKNLYIKLWRSKGGKPIAKFIINFIHNPIWVLYTGSGKIPFFLFFGWIFIPLVLIFELIIWCGKLNRDLSDEIKSKLKENAEILHILSETPQFGNCYHDVISLSLGLNV